MPVVSTQPVPPQRAERYREQGWWESTTSRAAQREALLAGGRRTAVIDDQDRWDYLRLVAAADAVGAALAARGVRPGDAVLIIAPLCNAAVAAYLGTVQAGAVAVLLDRRCGPADVDNACAAAQPVAVLSFTEHTERLGLRPDCPVIDVDAVLAADRRPLPASVPLDPDAPAVVVFTSGTTSAPKGVIHTRNSLRCGAVNMVAALEFSSADALFLSSPLASITGVLQLETALHTHGAVVLDECFDPADSLRRLFDAGATVLGGAPVIGEALFAEADQQGLTDLPLRCLAVGGSMIPPALLAAASRFGVQPVRVYGSSEAPFSTATAPEGDDLTDEGTALPGVEIRVGDSDELLIRGPHQFHGYLDAAQNTDAFADDWIRTGDRAEIVAGRLRITGRLKEIAIRKGMKISLAEIDLAAAALGDSGAYTVPDPDTGERVALALYPDSGSPTDFAGIIDRLAATGLATWKLPEEIVLWDRPLPRTETGKVIRNRLADPPESAVRLFRRFRHEQ